MLNIKKTAITTALLLTSGLVSATPISSLTLTGGTFAMAGAGGTINPGAFANMSVDGVTYDGSAPTTAGDEDHLALTSIGTFQFGIFGPVAIYTAPTDGVHPDAPFAAVTGDITGGVLSLDLSSWTANWSLTSFNQGTGGSIDATTYNAVTGDFTADWSALVVGGPYNGQTGVWHITGNAQVVPLPAAVWLFGSGLLGLAGVGRCRKAA